MEKPRIPKRLIAAILVVYAVLCIGSAPVRIVKAVGKRFF
jgi:hypothetical protein